MNRCIEFVEGKIKNEKKLLKKLKNLKTISNKYELKINESLTKNAEENLEYFQQIKTELEAWEEIQKHEFEIDRLDSVAEYYVVHVWKPFKPEEIEIIKKALGVENENIYC